MEIIIVILCAIGYGAAQYKLGCKIGAEQCLLVLQSEKIIKIDKDGNITPIV